MKYNIYRNFYLIFCTIILFYYGDMILSTFVEELSTYLEELSNNYSNQESARAKAEEEIEKEIEERRDFWLTVILIVVNFLLLCFGIL